jgi:hypothetical protein
MLILRIGNRGRWTGDRDAQDDEHVEAAAKDLKLGPRHQGLSVFRAETEAEQQEVALRFALTCRDARPEHVDYVAFPSSLAEDLGLIVAHRPYDDLDPYLSERHYEMIGLTPELGLHLATAILKHEDRLAGRLEKQEVPALGADLCRRDSRIRSYLGDGWPERLRPLLGDPETGD